MLVRPIKPGVYGAKKLLARRWPLNDEHRHRPGAGAPFKLEKPEHFSAKWMEIVEATPEEKAIAEAIAKRTKAKDEAREKAQLVGSKRSKKS